MIKTLLITTALVAVGTTTAVAQRQEPGFTKTLQMRAGMVTSWKSETPIQSAVIGKPDVVDAIPQNDKVLFITAKSQGSTNMMLIDEKGNVIDNVLVVVTNREVNRVNVHSKLRNLHGYWAYECTPTGCAPTDDKLAGSDRIPVYPPIIVAPQ